MALAAPSIFQTYRFTPDRAGIFGSNQRQALPIPQTAGIGAALTAADAANQNERGGGRDGGKGGSLSESTSAAASTSNSPGASPEVGFGKNVGRALGAVGKVANLGMGVGIAATAAGAAIDTTIGSKQLNAMGLPGLGLLGWGKAVIDTMTLGAPGWSVNQQMQQAVETAWGQGQTAFGAPPGSNMQSFETAGDYGDYSAPQDNFNEGYTTSPDGNYAGDFGGTGGAPGVGQNDGYGTSPDGNYGGDFGSTGGKGTDESTDEGDDDDDGTGDGDG